MNIKGIIGTVLMFIVITSCSQEALIGDEHPYETGTVTLNFTMGESSRTKASPSEVENAEGYIYSTKEELTVSTCFLAIYAKKEGDNEDQWSNKILTQNISESDLIVKKEGLFSISNITLPIKMDLKVVVIANFYEADYDPTYEELKTKIVFYTQETNENYYTFDPETLIKVGEDIIRFDTQNASKQIELTQLSAKIHLNLSLAAGGSFELQKVTIKNVERESPLFGSGYTSSRQSGEYTHSFTDKVVDKIDDVVFYTYAKKESSNTNDALTVNLIGVGLKDGEPTSEVSNSFNLYINTSVDIESGNYYEVTGILKESVSDLTVSGKEWITRELNVNYGQ